MSQSNGRDQVVQPLSPEEDAFALAYVAFGGNPYLAYARAFADLPKSSYDERDAHRLMTRLPVAERIIELRAAIGVFGEVTRAESQHQMAQIRDAAMGMNRFQEAVQAERARGEMAGLYKQHIDINRKDVVEIHGINVGAGSLEDWSAKRGTQPKLVEIVEGEARDVTPVLVGVRDG